MGRKTKQDIIEVGKIIVSVMDKDQMELDVYDGKPKDEPCGRYKYIERRAANAPILYGIFTVQTQHVRGLLEDLEFIMGANHFVKSKPWKMRYIENFTDDDEWAGIAEETYQDACYDVITYINDICQKEQWEYPIELAQIDGRNSWGEIQNYLEKTYKVNGGNYFYYLYMGRWEARQKEKELIAAGIIQTGACEYFC